MYPNEPNELETKVNYKKMIVKKLVLPIFHPTFIFFFFFFMTVFLKLGAQGQSLLEKTSIPNPQPNQRRSWPARSQREQMSPDWGPSTVQPHGGPGSHQDFRMRIGA